MKHRICILLAVLLLWPVSLLAATRAWLEQPQVTLGQAVTLNVETDAVSATPDLTPLMRDFEVEGQSDSRSVRMMNGRMSASTTFSLTLRPRRAGTLTIPALQVGNERTAPLTLEVGATATARAASNGLVFVETEVDDPNPYVQQSVGVTVRPYYATPLVSGQLDLDPPDGALLQRVGEIVQSSREIDGRRHAAEAQLTAKLSDTEKHIADVKRIALDHVSTIATETTEAVVEALVGKVSRDEAAAAVAAVSVGKH